MIAELLEKFEDVFEPASGDELEGRVAEILKEMEKIHYRELAKLPKLFKIMFDEINNLSHEVKVFVDNATFEKALTTHIDRPLYIEYNVIFTKTADFHLPIYEYRMAINRITQRYLNRDLWWDNSGVSGHIWIINWDSHVRKFTRKI